MWLNKCLGGRLLRVKLFITLMAIDLIIYQKILWYCLVKPLIFAKKLLRDNGHIRMNWLLKMAA